MFFDAALGELPLLVFSLLVPVGLAALGLMACARGFLPAGDEAAARRADMLVLVPGVLVLVGLAASFMHLGSPAHVLDMMAGVGRSPLSNEIAVAGASIAVAVVWCAACVAAHPGASAQRACGAVLLVLAVLTAVFTGTAYMIVTIPVWNTPWGAVSQVGLALLGGGVLAACCLAAAKGALSAPAGKMLLGMAAAGLVLLVAGLALLGSAAGAAMSSTGATLADALGTYAGVAVAAAALSLVGLAVWGTGVLKGAGTKPAAAAVACVAVLCGLALARVDFYGVFLSVGLG